MRTSNQMATATLDVSIRRNAIDLYRNACHKKNVPYTEFQVWVNEVKSQKSNITTYRNRFGRSG